MAAFLQGVGGARFELHIEGKERRRRGGKQEGREKGKGMF